MHISADTISDQLPKRTEHVYEFLKRPGALDTCRQHVLAWGTECVRQARAVGQWEDDYRAHEERIFNEFRLRLQVVGPPAPGWVWEYFESGPWETFTLGKTGSEPGAKPGFNRRVVRSRMSSKSVPVPAWGWWPPHLLRKNYPEGREPPLPLSDTTLTILEKYVVVAVLYDAYYANRGLEPMNPWLRIPCPDDRREANSFHVARVGYEGQVGEVGRIRETDWSAIDGILKDVEQDISKALPTDQKPTEAANTPPATHESGKRPANTDGREESGGIGESNDIAELVRSTPMLSQDNGEWVMNKQAARSEGVTTRTLAQYRQQGIADAESRLGRDKDGRIWRRPGTQTSHPWYLRQTLKSAFTKANSKP